MTGQHKLCVDNAVTLEERVMTETLVLDESDIIFSPAQFGRAHAVTGLLLGGRGFQNP